MSVAPPAPLSRTHRRADVPSAALSGARAVVIIPTFNEAVNIGPVLREVMELPGSGAGDGGRFAVIVVDDGSPDGTADRVRGLQLAYPDRIGLVERDEKGGLGTAYLAGFHHALAAGYEFVCEMDADFSHNPRDLPLLVEAVRDGRADVAIGSRYVGGVRVVDWPLSRLLLSYGAGVYTRLITRLPVQDVTAGFKCFRRTVLERLDLARVTSNGYSFQIEMTYRAWRAGFRVVEVPIVFTERAEGQSKMSRSIVREAAVKVWELRWLDFRRRL